MGDQSEIGEAVLKEGKQSRVGGRRRRKGEALNERRLSDETQKLASRSGVRP